MRVAIVSVGKVDGDVVFDFLDSLSVKPTHILTQAKGSAGWWAESWTEGRGVEIVRHEPNFKLWGKRGQPKADDAMIFDCDALAAFHNNKSKMVAGMIKYAMYQKKDVFVCYLN